MINKTLLNYLSFFILVLISACANQKPPTGGPEDYNPPVLKKSTPENNSVNFKEKTIVLEFDEYVDAQKLRENIIISPLIEGQFDVVARKKTVFIKFRESFKDNTTYNINFGESIKDVTRSNISKNLTLAFSTGPFIDSLSIKGNVYNFVKGGGMKDISVQLYTTADTNNIKNNKPLYYTKTDEAGNFIINNIKEGTYDVYALQDNNANFKYDNEKESIAYLYDLLINKKINDIKLGITKSDTKPPIIISKKSENEHYLFNVSEGLENYTLKTKTLKVLTDLSEDKKTIKIFNTFNSKDSIQIYYELTDSSGNINVDSTKILFEELKNKKVKNNFSFLIPVNKLQIIKNEDINIKFNKPISQINYTQIKIKKDTTQQTIDENKIVLDSTTLLRLKLINTYRFKDSLLLNFGKGAFISIDGDSSYATKFKISYKKEELFGIIGGTIICKDSNYIFQLIDSKGQVLDAKHNATKFYYNYLEPSNYILKIIVDINNNGRWDPTDIYKNTPPEPIHYYKEKITLRANWELLDLKFEVK